MRRAALLALAAAACTEAVDAPPLGDYTTWPQGRDLEIRRRATPATAASASIYVNDVARTAGPTAKDAVLVKEVRDDDGGALGALRYVAIMRKLRAGPDPADEGGWLFSQADTPGGAERHSDLCWRRCHAQAPLAGVWPGPHGVLKEWSFAKPRWRQVGRRTAWTTKVRRGMANGLPPPETRERSARGGRTMLRQHAGQRPGAVVTEGGDVVAEALHQRDEQVYITPPLA